MDGPNRSCSDAVRRTEKKEPGKKFVAGDLNSALPRFGLRPLRLIRRIRDRSIHSWLYGLGRISGTLPIPCELLLRRQLDVHRRRGSVIGYRPIRRATVAALCYRAVRYVDFTGWIYGDALTAKKPPSLPQEPESLLRPLDLGLHDIRRPST